MKHIAVLLFCLLFCLSGHAAKYNIVTLNTDSPTVTIVLFESIAKNAVLDVYLTQGACTNNTVGNATLIQHNVPNHDVVQFTLAAPGTYCYYSQKTSSNGVATKPDTLETIIYASPATPTK